MKLPEINDRIVQIMEVADLGTNAFAKAIDTSGAVISHIAKGRNKPNFDLIVKIAKRFPNVNIEWLILGADQMKVDPSATLDEKPQISNAVTNSPKRNKKQDGSNEIESDQALLFELISAQKEVIRAFDKVQEIQHRLLERFKSN